MRRVKTDELKERERIALRGLLDSAFGAGFTDDDWQHALGGMHFILEVDAAMRSHAAVVERTLLIGGKPSRTGYVEAVATAPADQGLGYGSQVMRAVNIFIAEQYELGALSTGLNGFYARLGWQDWLGPSLVRTDAGEEETPEADGTIMVLTTSATEGIDVREPISCEWRPGDAW